MEKVSKSFTVQRDMQGNVFHILLWQYKWRYKLILSHLKINWSPFPTFSFLYDSQIQFFNNSREFLSQPKNFQILSYPKIPVSVNLLYMFLCLSESSISCWKETIEEKNFFQGTMQILQEENTLNLFYNSALWFEGLQDFLAANF